LGGSGRFSKSTTLWLFSASTQSKYDASPETQSAVGGDEAGSFFCVDGGSAHVVIQDGFYDQFDPSDAFTGFIGFWSVNAFVSFVQESQTPNVNNMDLVL
jgi:hypothetical protein